MTRQILIGLGAGLTSALLYVSAATMSPLAMMLFYLGPLPILLASLGWGTATGLIAGAAGGIAIGLGTGILGAVVFVATVAAPVLVLGNLAMLSRQNSDGQTEWYPPGRLAVWAALLSAGLTLSVMFLLGLGPAEIEAAIGELMQRFIASEPQLQGQEEQLRVLTQVLARALVPVSTVGWTLALVVNLWLAGRILKASDRLRRPWPDLTRLQAPERLYLPLAGALALAFAGGGLGLAGEVVAASLIFVYVLIGLSIIHHIVPPGPGRPLILTGVYLTLLFFTMPLRFLPVLAVAALGMAEPFLKLRDRFGPGGPTPPAPKPD